MTITRNLYKSIDYINRTALELYLKSGSKLGKLGQKSKEDIIDQ